MSYLIEDKNPFIGPFFFQKKLRSAIVISLRNSFKDDPQYTYVEDSNHMTDFVNSKIDIVDVKPLTTIKLPTIVVVNLTDKESSFFFKNDYIGIDPENPNYEIYGNYILSTLGIDIHAFSSIERDELGDKTYYYLRTDREFLVPFGVELRKISINSIREVEFGERILYQIGMSVNLYSEWEVKVNKNNQNDIIITEIKYDIK